MKNYGKIIAILFIFLILGGKVGEAYRLIKVSKEFKKINSKDLTNENDAFLPSENPTLLNSLASEKQAKPFFLLLLGEKQWKSLNQILSPLGEKWKGRILKKLDRLPQNVDDEVYKTLKNGDVGKNNREIRRMKDELRRKLQEFELKTEEKEKNSESLEQNPAIKKILPDFLEEIERNYNIDFDSLSDLSLSDPEFEAKFVRFTESMADEPSKLFKDSPRFSESSLNPLTIIDNLGTDEMFDGKKADPSDSLPEPNSEESGTLCTDPMNCLGFQLKIMKCTLIRMVMRMIYEMVCAIENFFADIVSKICACSPIDQPPYYLKEKDMSCNNRSSWPGIICNLGYMALLALYSICFILWKIIFIFTQLCKVPLGELIIASPP